MPRLKHKLACRKAELTQRLGDARTMFVERLSDVVSNVKLQDSGAYLVKVLPISSMAESVLLNPVRTRAHVCRQVALGRRQQRCVLVHTMGKVGSSSVYDALRASGLGVPVLHTHTIDSDARAVRLAEQAPRGLWSLSPRSHLVASAVANKLSADPSIEFDLVSLVRPPAERNLSAFFENLDRFAPGRDSPEALTAAFLDGYPHNLPDTWFDREVRSPFGIDVYDRPFSESGWEMYSHGRTRLLILRLDVLDTVGAGVIADFLRLDQLEITISNQAADKSYADAYRSVRHGHGLDEYRERMAASRYGRHFFSSSVG